MNNPEINLGLVGATGLVGKTVLKILPEYAIDIGELRSFASEGSEGKTIEYEDEQLTIRHARSADDFRGLDVVIASAGGDKAKKAVSEEIRPMIEAAGAVMIDNSSAFRREKDVPLVVAGVNDDELESVRRGQTVANPNCTTMIGMMAIKPLHNAAGLKSINVSTYQAVSGQGQKAIDETLEMTEKALELPADSFVNGKAVVISNIFPVSPVFNVAPYCGEDYKHDERQTTEETKFVNESRKILGLDNLAVTATCARVLVLNGHSLSMSLGFERDISPEQAEELLSEAPGVQLAKVPMAVNAAGIDDVLVGRIRRDPTTENGLQLWVAGDNLRKGAATNAVQIAEALAHQGL